MGKVLKDSCVAYGSVQGSGRYFGKQAIALGDVSGDGRADFMVAQEATTAQYFATGEVDVFLGDSHYGPKVAGIESPTLPPRGFRLDQNFPNPAVDATDITFAVSDPALWGKELTLRLFDMLGHEIMTPYRGTVDGFGYTVRVRTAGLPGGVYAYRLCAGQYEVSKRMCIVR
jgi:hypothetical protein